MVVSDIMMPEMDGYQLCRRIKEDNNFKDVPVILLTSLSDPVDVIKGLECGADNFITKPYDENYLLSRIQYILINRKLYKSDKMQMEIEIFFAGQKYFITSERQQILNLLLSTYETAVQKNLELIRARNELKLLNEHLEEFVDLSDDDPMAELWGFTQVRIYEHDDGVLPEDVIREELAEYLRQQQITSPKTQATG